MALSSSQKPPTAQHYLNCDTKYCDKNCQFYCNDCYRSLCEQCKDKHQKSPYTKSHKVVPFRQRKRELPEVKCQTHATKVIDMFCEQCQVPVCSKCATQDHGGHSFNDLELIYAKTCDVYLNDILKLEDYYIPTTQGLLKSTKEDSTEIKKIMGSIRTSMRAEAESLKILVETVTTDNIEQVKKLEKSLLELIEIQDIKYNDYISYLNELVIKFHGYLASDDLQTLICESSTNLKIEPIPETIKPVLPIFTPGRHSNVNIANLLGKITVPDTNPVARKIKQIENQMKPIGKQGKQERGEFDVKQTLALSSSVTEVRKFSVPGVDNALHTSFNYSDRILISDEMGNFIQTDLFGKQINKIQTCDGHGYHTVTQDGDVIYADKDNRVINMITPDDTITEFIKVKDWTPICVHSSRINGDILVGVRKDKEAKVMRYNRKGLEMQNIQRDNRGQRLYEYPRYITENINGDICISDLNKQAVVLVNRSGHHRFTYTGQGSEIIPYGICTDVLGHILVCDCSGLGTIHLLDQDGQVLSQLFTSDSVKLIEYPCSLCLDDQNFLYVGQFYSNTMTVYKYLQ